MRMPAPLFIESQTRGLRHAVFGLVAFLSQAIATAQQMPEGMAPQGPPPLPHPDIALPPVVPEHASPWLVAGGLLLLGLLVAGLILLLFGRKSPASAAAKRPVKDAVRALKDLRNRADALGPSEVGHRVSEILRRFHEARYGIPAPYRTSQELFPNVDMSAEPLRRRLWRERYQPLAAVYDVLSYGPMPATKAEALTLIDTSLEKLGEERQNEDALAD